MSESPFDSPFFLSSLSHLISLPFTLKLSVPLTFPLCPLTPSYFLHSHPSLLPFTLLPQLMQKQDVECFAQRLPSPPDGRTRPSGPWPHGSPGNGHTAVHQGPQVTPLPWDLNALMFENCPCPQQETAQAGHGMSLVTRARTGRKKSE